MIIKGILMMMILFIYQGYTHASTHISIDTQPSLDLNILNTSHQQDTQIFTFVDTDALHEPRIPTGTIDITGNISLYVPPTTRVVHIEQTQQSTVLFSDQVSSDYNSGFLLYGTTFLLITLSLFSK